MGVSGASPASHPERFGQTWQLTTFFGVNGHDFGPASRVLRAVAADRDVSGVDDARIAGAQSGQVSIESFTYAPVGGKRPAVVLTAGRMPTRPDEIVLAATTLSSTKTGALIIIERNMGLKNVTDGGVKLDAELSYDLLVSIFNPATPLHDGAVVVRRHRIAAASCFLPLTLNPLLSRELGTRHRAAIGVTEDTDAVAVVVSEETGLISFVQRGQIKRGLDAPRLRAAILQALEVSAKREQDKEPEKLVETEAETEEVASV